MSSDYTICSMGNFGGHFYKVIGYPLGERTWHAANAHAESMPPIGCGRGHLVSIGSAEEQAYISGLLTTCGDNDAWIGIENAIGNTPTDFTWVDNSANTYTNWCEGQPSQIGELFGEVWLDARGVQGTGSAEVLAPGCWNDNEPNLSCDNNEGFNGCNNDKYVLEYECEQGGGGFGDPHFLTWTNEMFDFQGECDMTLVDAPHFAPNLGVKIDVRTTIRYDYSFIETAAIMVGEDILEISGLGQYFFNGVESAAMPNTIGPLSFTHESRDKKTHFFTLAAEDGTKIAVKTHKDMVSIKVEDANVDSFRDSRGLLGDFAYGTKLARNGTAMEDPIAFAEEWQVRANEPMLFHAAREPQFPRACTLPKESTSTQRRLGESLALESAKQACANWDAHIRAACIHDVMATGDLTLAKVGAF